MILIIKVLSECRIITMDKNLTSDDADFNMIAKPEAMLKLLQE